MLSCGGREGDGKCCPLGSLFLSLYFSLCLSVSVTVFRCSDSVFFLSERRVSSSNIGVAAPILLLLITIIIMAMLVKMFTKRAITPTNPPPLTYPPSKVWFENCTLEDFEIGQCLGAGNFGQVFIARHIQTDHVCAIKSMSKASIVKAKQVAHVKAEKDILQKVDFPFIVNLLGYCQDDECVHLIMEYVGGGDFFGHLRSREKLDENTARFYAAQVLLSFEYLHSMDIIYRDLKPENLLLDEKGNIKIADFGFAKKIEHRTFTLCGTPDYLAPEIILAKGHGKPVDWWTLGVLIYEMLAGVAPFFDGNASGTYQNILDGKLLFPRHFSKSARDLVRKLLVADLSKRIGCLKGGVNEIKKHPWFANVKWDSVLHKKEAAPIKPKPLGSPSDTCNFEDFSNLPPIEHPCALTPEDQALFNDL